MVTRADVARLAGVSETAVSYAISGRRPISPGTRARIFSAMEELSYRPNAMARGLAGGRTGIIALLFPTGPRGISNADLEYVVGAADAARELGYHLVLWPTAGSDIEEARALHRAGMIDGVLLMEVRLEDERVTELAGSGFDVGLIGRTGDMRDRDIAYADRDFVSASALAVNHLAELGHRHLLFVDGSTAAYRARSSAMHLAEDGFRTACRRVGVTADVARVEPQISAGRALYQRRLQDTEITGVVSLNAEASIGVLLAAQADGDRVPRELSIVSIATPAHLVESTAPQLTTVSPPAYEIGSSAARALISRVAGVDVDPGPLLWTGELVVRGSSGPPHSPRKRR